MQISANTSVKTIEGHVFAIPCPALPTAPVSFPSLCKQYTPTKSVITKLQNVLGSAT